jgi:hypothetical protein
MDSARTPIPADVIGSGTALSEPLDWQQIANEMAAEVIRLRAEVDRLSDLQRGGGKEPLESKADWTHPLYPLWIELHLDDIEKLRIAWDFVAHRNHCWKCDSPLLPLYGGAACEDCALVYYASDGHFALDTVERAMDRGPDA